MRLLTSQDGVMVMPLAEVDGVECGPAVHRAARRG